VFRRRVIIYLFVLYVVGAACTAPARPVATVAPTLLAVPAALDEPASPGGSVHWTGRADAPATVEEYGDFQ
jgi:hypothetical protein